MKVNMKNNNLRFLIIMSILFVVYSVVVFALPFAMNAVFWMSYIFSVAAIAVQWVVFKKAFDNGEGLKSKFYGFPIANIGFGYFAVQLIASVIFMALALYVPVWLPLIVYVVALGIATIGFIAADAVREEVEKQDVKLKKSISRMKTMQGKMNVIASMGDYTAIKQLAEAFKYSDPVSSEELDNIETILEGCIAELQGAVKAKDTATITQLCEKTEALLNERNQLCKLYKNKKIPIRGQQYDSF